MVMKVTLEEIEAKKTAKGGWTKDTLHDWGIPWPPPKGWKQGLIEGRVLLWQAGAYEFEATPEMIRAFKDAHHAWQDGPMGWSWSVGCKKILAAVLEAARPGDIRSSDGADRHTRRKRHASGAVFASR